MSSRGGAGWLLALGLCGAPAGCVQLQYTTHWYDAPVADAVLQQLQAGRDDLGSCLAALGAPQLVWEYAGSGAALAWAFGDDSAWGLGVGYSFDEFSNVSFDFDSAALQLPGVVLWFDAGLRLERWQRGLLADLTAGLRRRRPAPPD